MAVRKKKKVKPTYKVYCTYFPNGEYYIGFSTKMGAAYDKYFGSNAEILAMVKGGDHGLVKETIAEFDKKSFGKMQEFLLQWQNRHDPLMRNDMINIRLRMSYLSDFEPVEWSPKSIDQIGHLSEST